ncbi:SMEK domain-containing protein [Atopobiaceae bacterium LCP21S3_F11]
MTLQRETNTNEFVTLITRLSQELQQHANINLQSALVHAEEAFKRILLSVYGYKLSNANEAEHNSPGVDLIDDENKLVFQVTISATREKVENTLSRKAIKGYADEGYRLKFMFVGLSKLCDARKEYANPYSIAFDHHSDCLYCSDISDAFSRLDIPKQEIALHILKQELGEGFLLTTDVLKQQFELSKRMLGVRYSPNLSVPVEAFGYLRAFSNPDDVKKCVGACLSELSHACKRALNLDPEKLANEKRETIELLLDATLKAETKTTQRALLNVENGAKALNYAYSPKDDPAEINSVIHKYHSLHKLCSESGFAYTEKNFVLFTGNGGIGKSHYLADCCEKAIQEGNAAFLILGQEFVTSQSPCSQIATRIAGNSNHAACFSEINRFAESRGHRAIIAIDALNEGIGRDYWTDHLPSLVETIRPFKNIILLASVRSTYEDEVIPPDYIKSDCAFSRVQLTGFSNSPDAVRLFCEHYQIEPPAFPPYGEEYSNPLYLRTICEAIFEKGIGKFELSISFNEAVFLCLNAINKRVCNDLRCRPTTNIVHKALAALVDVSSFSQYGSVLYDDAIQSIHSAIQLYTDKAGKMIELLEAESIINVDSYGQNAYVRFCYERFGDYVCASHVVSKAANGAPSRKEAIRNSKTIHKLLCSEYMQGASEALAILLAETEGVSILEILDLNDKDEEERAFDLLLSTIPWDRTGTICSRTEEFIKENILPNPNRMISLFIELLDTALSPSNAFNAKTFEKLAYALPVQEREGVLSIAVYSNASVLGTLKWLQKNYRVISDECAELAFAFLPWLMASTSFEIRDWATKTLSCCLLRKPARANMLAKKLGNFEDDYIDERLIAAIYGAASNAEDRLTEFLDACNTIYTYVYGGEHTHPNIMLRNYADCLVDLMKVLGLINADECRMSSNRGNAAWYDTSVSNEEIDEYLADCELQYGEKSQEASNLWWIIHSMTTEYGRGRCAYGDFGRYVFGSQVSCWRNQFKNDQDLANLALKELLDHFYSARWHASFDSRVKHSREDSGFGFERISKKYQWICMHRLIGRLIDNYPPYEERIKYDQVYLDYQHNKGARFWAALESEGDYPAIDEEEELNPDDYIIDVKRRPLEADEMFWELESLRDFDPTYLALHKISSEGASVVASELSSFSINQSNAELCELLIPFHETKINGDKYISIWSLFTMKEPNNTARETHWQSFAVAASESDMLNSLKDKKKLAVGSNHTPETMKVYSRETGGYLASRLDNEFRVRDLGEDGETLVPLSVGYLWEPVRDGTNDSGESARIQNPSYDLIRSLDLTQAESGVWKSGDTTVCIEKASTEGKCLYIKEEWLLRFMNKQNLSLGWHEYFETTSTECTRKAVWLFCMRTNEGNTEYEILDNETYDLDRRWFMN